MIRKRTKPRRKVHPMPMVAVFHPSWTAGKAGIPIPKHLLDGTERLKIVDLRALARGQMCQVRCGPACRGQDDTVHLAHYRMLPYNGVGMKPPDWLGAWACSYCASATGEGSNIHNRLALAEGVLRTIGKLIDLGAIKL